MRQDVVYLLMFFVFLSLAISLSNPPPKDIIEAEEGDLVEFEGICVYSSDDFSIITDGKFSVPVLSGLEVGKAYKIVGVYRGEAIKPGIIEKTEGEELSLVRVTGAYWVDYYPYILTPKKVKLKFELENVSIGEIVEVKGVFFGTKLVPVEYKSLGFLSYPKDGYPFEFTGVVLYGGNPGGILWMNKSVRAYLPDNQTLTPGQVVKIVGITKVSGDYISVYARNFSVVDFAKETTNIEGAKVGEIIVGSCRVSRVFLEYLELECLDKKVFGVKGRVGDLVHFKALKRFGSYLCLECNLTAREDMENSICTPQIGKVGKVAGKVVKVSKNKILVEFNRCKVSVKLPEGVKVREGDYITAYGVFSTYYDKPMLIVYGEEDVCVNYCS